MVFPSASVVKNLPANEGDVGWILALRRSLRGRNGYPLLYSCLENTMERGAWQAAVHGAATEMDTTQRISIAHCIYIYTYTHTLAAAAAKLLQSCPTLCDPQTAAHRAPPSLGFSRQEHWSGLPFPSPMHESESEVTQSCPTLSYPMDYTAHQAPPFTGFSRQEYNCNLCMHAKSLQLCLTLCDLMDFSPPGSSSMGFFRQEYWSGLSFPPPGDLPSLGIEPTSLMFSTLAGRFFITSATWETQLQFGRPQQHTEIFGATLAFNIEAQSSKTALCKH